MIERGIGAAVAKSPMHIASGGPTSAASCFIRVSAIAARELRPRGRNTYRLAYSYVGGYELIHDSDPVSKVIRRELSIGVLQFARHHCPLQSLAGQTRLIDSPGLAERQPMRGADLFFEKLL